MKLANAFL